jgi:hypothetical protein
MAWKDDVGSALSLSVELHDIKDRLEVAGASEDYVLQLTNIWNALSGVDHALLCFSEHGPFGVRRSRMNNYKQVEDEFASMADRSLRMGRSVLRLAKHELERLNWQ